VEGKVLKMNKNIFFIVLIINILLSCKFVNQNERQVMVFDDSEIEINDVTDLFTEEIPKKIKSKIEQYLENLGLIDIHSIDSAFVIDLKYSTEDNFTGQILYDSLKSAYFQPDVALMLYNAKRYLQDTFPDANIIIYDAARPLSIQRIMYEAVKDTPFRNYVANPDRTGLHNYGAAVDLTILDSNGQPLDMGTPFDHFGRAAAIIREDELLAAGILSANHIKNRQLLRYVMRKAGFITVNGEWWHFNALSLNEAKNRYEVIY
jgi:D-alanyl-D-alanine dipeptidase